MSRFNVVIQQEDEWFTAECLGNGVASQGHCVEEALKNLKEALELYYEDEELPESTPAAFLTSLEVAV